jgi:DNA polymerase III delta' subunit
MTAHAAVRPPADRGDALPAGLHVRGQDAAAAAGLDLVRTGRAQSILLVGPAGVGKTTLALDLAATLMCTADPGDRPCLACRGCRMVASGNHPDLHRLAPEGAGGQIRIGARTEADPGTVRRLIGDLSLLPVEGGARVAVVEHADRMNEDAQSALLKTLEEPPSGVTLLLCADEEERLLPTVRSRCARVRLGPLGARAIEQLLGELGAADAPSASRLGRLAGGRPGTALAYAAAPEAVVARGEIARTLLDLLLAGRAARLGAVRGLLAGAGEAAAALARTRDPRPTRASSGRRPAADPPATSAAARADEVPPADAPDAEPEAVGAAARRAPVAERRRAALFLLETWRTVARDLALGQLGDTGRVRDRALLDDLGPAARSLPAGAAARFLARLDRAGELLESNVSPELVVDDLVLAWPRGAAAR